MKKRLLAIAIIAGLGLSCEKVIDVPLNEADQKVVVEAVLYDVPYQSFVKLSKTGSVYESSDFEKVTGAIVTITDDLSNTWTFTEDPSEPGMYLDSTFTTQPFRTYSLSVDNGGIIYTAHSTTNSTPAFDSLDYQTNVGGFGQDPEDTTFFVFYNLPDPANETNFYRVIPFVNGYSEGDYLNDDQLINGNTLRQPFFASALESGDTLDAVVLSMDNANYTYFVTLANAQDGGPFSPAPGNPVTNIDGGALGYFGAYTSDIETIIFP